MKTVVGQTDSAFQGGLTADGYVWRMTSESPGGHLFDDVIHKYAVALWLFDQDIVSVQAVVRRRDYFFEPCAAIFEYEDPGILGTMDVSYAPQMWLRSQLLRGRRVLRGPGGRGLPVGDPVHRARCSTCPPSSSTTARTAQETTTSFPTVDADWGRASSGRPTTSSTPSSTACPPR